MVHQITNKNVIDLEVCSVSYQRHRTSLLKKRGKITNTLCKKPAMAENTDRHPLPVVELRPFSKKVWRREKSLPDFYDKRKCDEVNLSSSSNSLPDNDTPGTRLIREMTETRRSIETRQHTLDSAMGKYRNHPKAEFLHESNKAWRKQDLIPSFITRFERTKTSLDTLSRDSTLHRINLENMSMFDNALKGEPNSMIKVKGGKMSQQIQRRHFLYLNPLDTYRQPNSWVPHFSTTNNARQNTTRDKLLLSSRHSIPLTSSRTRDLLLGDSQSQYPLRPIRREDMESPHKFNSKLGAAKNSLEVLSKVGIQTKLEKALEKEMEWNMEKFRKDRLLFTSDLKGVPFQCFNVDSNNMTVGEMSLKTAREANKLAKGKQRQNNARRINTLGEELTASDIYNSCTPDDGTPRLPNSSVVNPVLHPIGHPLLEEMETYVSSDSTLIAAHKLVGRGRGQNQVGATPATKGNAISSDDLLQSNNVDVKSIGNNGVSNSTKVWVNPNTSGQGTGEINNNSNNVISKEGVKVIDSSRIETNVAYLENLQMKTAQGYPTSSNATPPLDLTHTADKTHPVSTDDTAHVQANNGQQLTPSQHSEYTSHHDQSVLNSQRVTPHTATNSSLSQQQQQHQQQQQQLANQQNDSQQNSLQNQEPKEWQTNKSEPPSDQTTSQAPQELSMSKEIQPENNPATDPSSDPSKTILESSSADDIPEKLNRQSESVPVEDDRRQPVVEINNSSPLTSSGFESQPTTDHEDDLSPSSDQHGVFKEQTRADADTGETILDDGKSPTSQSSKEDIDPKSVVSSGNDEVETGSDQQNDSSDLPDSAQSEERKEMAAAQGKQPTPMLAHQGKMAAQFPPEVDEGIGLVSTEAAVLDSSVTEVCSDQGVTGIADNGDSGVSTTFLTSEDSVPEPMEAVVVS